jgi:hypothetical protein
VKRPFAALFLALAFAGFAMALWLSGSTPLRQTAPSITPSPTAPAPASLPLAKVRPSISEPTPATTPESSPLAAELNGPQSTARRDVEIVQLLLHQYLRRLHQRQGPPIGDDIDLARALTGKNPLHLALLPADHPAITADGHLRDRWGSPYFIHAKGRDAFEIRSAGPDRKLFTGDDIIGLER